MTVLRFLELRVHGVLPALGPCRRGLRRRATLHRDRHPARFPFQPFNGACHEAVVLLVDGLPSFLDRGVEAFATSLPWSLSLLSLRTFSTE
jgi:hypothetical protein